MRGILSSFFSRRLAKKKRVRVLGDPRLSAPVHLSQAELHGTGLRKTRFGKYDLSPLRAFGTKIILWGAVLAFLLWLLWESAAALKIF